MNIDRLLALASQGLVAGAVYVGGTAGHIMGVIGGLLSVFANRSKIGPQPKPSCDDDMPEQTA